jgi:hypothetical protein
MKAYWGSGGIVPQTLALDGCEWSASCTGRFTRRERVPGTHWTGGWVGPRTGLDAVVKRKIPCQDSNPRSSSYTAEFNTNFAYSKLKNIMKNIVLKN